MSVHVEAIRALTEIVDVGQMAQVAAEGPSVAFKGLIGFVVVMTALIGIWFVTSTVGIYFAKTGAASKKAEAAPKAQSAAPAAQPVAAAPADEIPLAVIVAAAAWAVGGQVRNVRVNVGGRESVTWTAQGRQAIYASHGAKAAPAVSPLGSVRQK
jgi:hypothetical protein